MLGRLLEDLQQRVEGRQGEHMHLVDDVHALFHRGRREDRLVAQGAHVVHPVVRGGVKLHHVKHGAVEDAAAGGADPAGVAVDRMLAVDRAGEDARAGGLAGAARADEEIGMAQPPGLHLIFQGLRDVVLPHDLVEGLRPPLAVQRLVHASPSPYWDLSRPAPGGPIINGS